MKKYERSLKSQLLSSLFFTIFCLIQLVINILDNRPKLFIITFSCLLVIFVVITILIILDIILKDALKIKGKINKIEGNIISVLKTNGKTRKVRIPTAEELELYRMDQEIELVSAKRTGILNKINTFSSKS